MLNNLTNKNHKFANLFGPGSVPGYLTDGDMLAIAELTKKLPKIGIFVEIGCFLGKSSAEWAKNLQEQNKNYRIICIDSFNSPIEVLQQLLREAEFDVPPGTSQMEFFRHYTTQYPSIRALEAFVNRNFYFEKVVAGVFEDSEHTQEALSHALPFWWKRIQSGGILSGHDYTMDEVRVSVDLFAIFNELEVKIFPDSSVWYIEKP